MTTTMVRAGGSPERVAPPRSTTRKSLRRLRVVLLVALVVMLVTSWTVFQGVHYTADVLHDRAVPAVISAADARAALVEADAAAIQSFSTGQASLGGPGVQYLNQIAVASRSLAQVAENNVAGSAGSQQIQLVWGLLIAYMGLIEQADVQYRQNQDNTLGIVHLWYASRLLHNELLGQLDLLREGQKEALDNRISSGWMNPLAAVMWTVPTGAFLVLLTATQVYLRRRFRRTLNFLLVGGTMLVLLFAAASSFSFVSQDRLRDVQHSVVELGNDWDAQVNATDLRGQQALKHLVLKHCPSVGAGQSASGACSVTVSTFSTKLEGSGSGDGADPGERPTRRIGDVDEQALAASDTLRIEFMLPVVALLAGGLILLGLQPRIDEYRFRR